MTENTVPLRGVQACVFDAYGTLFDFAAAARKCRDVLGDDIDRLTALWRDKQLQYTWLRATQQRHADFWQVTGDALDFALETIGLKKPGLRDRLMSLYLTLDPFPEVPNVLRKLKAAGMRTAILSNGSPAMLDAAVKAARLEPLLDAVGSTGLGCLVSLEKKVAWIVKVWPTTCVSAQTAARKSKCARHRRSLCRVSFVVGRQRKIGTEKSDRGSGHSSGRIPESAWTDMCPDRCRSNEEETAYEYQT